MIRASAAAFALVVSSLPLTPPEHAHLGSEGHPALVHRHAEPHGHHAHGSGLVFDDDDADATAVWTDTSYVIPAQLTLPVSLIVDWRHPGVEPPSAKLASVRVEVTERRVHDPPRRPRSLRAPPAILSV